ncbi:hypothetical protein OG689_41625 [Kitasatospora sp. NBC_00240]|uniref:hypothetical protein n=1 Tax=Kitasatospora sp. NBC_00240 TaxID=2903567 RepID=UPI0022568113|nr:hypothetical protein [Kitasatospora sp. NBC_00240]MCX5215658.1 hypothetical protein [Kitasatospora sp. NBC_00240]
MSPSPATDIISPATVGRGSVRQRLDRGTHPATLKPLKPTAPDAPAAFCGGCASLQPRIIGDGSTRLKCARKATRRRGPDLKPDFPACEDYQAASA